MLNLPFVLPILATASIAYAGSDSEKLTKPTLNSNLDFLSQGMIQSLPNTTYTLKAWDHGTLPQVCKDTVTSSDTWSYDPADLEIYDVEYEDCAGDPWVFCHHKESNVTIDSIAISFGQMPIQMRQWVRHVIDGPWDSTSAFEINGDITVFGPHDGMVKLFTHETGHSLDFNGAYSEKPLSSSDKYWDAYNKDSDIPSDYAGTDIAEDLAESTSIAVYDLNVPGGFASVEPDYKKVFNQYNILIKEAEAAGSGNSIFLPGQNQKCNKYPSSPTVSLD